MSHKGQLYLFFGGVACIGAGLGVHDAIFNNFLSDTFSLNADTRGALEFPRELPGFLVVLMTGLLAALTVTRLAMVGATLVTLGFVGMGVFGLSYWPMVAMMFVASQGMHLLMPASGSLAVALSTQENRGILMGMSGVMGTLGSIVGAGFIWLWLDKASPQYRTGFLCAAVFAAAAVGFYTLMRMPHSGRSRMRFVIHRKFTLYYVLELLHGARKQIFLTFGPWVLIKIYHFPATSMAGLMITYAVIGLVTQPLAGMAIDRFGERAVMIFDGLALFMVCIGYGYAVIIMGDADHARPLARACYVLDNMLFSLGNARIIYMSRRADSPEEITATLALGVSINHAVSMLIPMVAGTMWVLFGYERVFAGGAVLALVLAVIATRVPSKAARLNVAAETPSG